MSVFLPSLGEDYVINRVVGVEVGLPGGFEFVAQPRYECGGSGEGIAKIALHSVSIVGDAMVVGRWEGCLLQ